MATEARKAELRAMSDAGSPQYRRASVAARFWSKVEYTDGCWLWRGAKDQHGYGCFGINYRVIKAPRVAYELTKGSIPEGMDILHSCDTPACVRPDHLRPGTARDNAQDMLARGRHFTPFKTHRYTRPRQTECFLGHPFDAANTSIARDGSQRCRACARERTARYRLTLKGKAALLEEEAPS